MGRLDEIQHIIQNESKPISEQDPMIRALNDRDIDWLIARVVKLSGILKLLESVPFGSLTPKSFTTLIKDGLKE